MQLTLTCSAAEQRRIKALNARIDRLGDKIIALRARGYTTDDRPMARLLGKQRAALAEWHRLRWPR